MPSRARKIVARLSGYRVVPFDPVLRDRGQDAARREAWLRDQYRHPEEHTHTIADVQRWFAENDVEYLRTYPSAVWGDESGDLFARAEDNWRLESWLAQLGWMRTLGREGGLFFTIGVCRAAGHPIGDHKRVGAAVSILTPRCLAHANLCGCWPKGQCRWRALITFRQATCCAMRTIDMIDV